jgi:hypothetical protein
VVAVVVAWALGVGVGAGGALGSGGPSAWPVCIARTTAVHTGISELGRSVRGRLVTYTLRSRAMHVNVLLPAHFDPSGRTRYPVLYLLHGALGNYASGTLSSWPSSARCQSSRSCRAAPRSSPEAR